MTDYEWLDKMHLCHRCRKARPAPRRKYCFDCLDKIRDENERRYDPQRAKAYQVRRRELYAKKKQDGICVRCSKSATHGLYCYEHMLEAKRHSARTAACRKAERHERGLVPDFRKGNGLCLRCGNATDGTYCPECAKNMADALEKGRKNSPFRRLEKLRYMERRP